MKSLKQRYDFLRLKKEGKIARSCHWFFLNYIKNQSGGVRLGLTVPKYCGKAVTRNKLKRWCRDFFRNWDEEIHADINVVFRKMPESFYEKLKRDELIFNIKKIVSKLK